MASLSREAILQTPPVTSKRKSEDSCTESGPWESSKRQKVDSRRDRGRRESERAGRSEKRNLGRSQYNRSSVSKRARNADKQQSSLSVEAKHDQARPLPVYATTFSTEEIEAEPRRSKSKVAVMMGYSGSGYKGMQLNDTEKTIEGDLFSALVRAGAISKANADDAKKSSLVRCARTDKGVHAAGNVISLKLIMEDPDIIAKINAELSPQIRVYGISRVNGSFSAYQLCDSRIYEYLIPTHCFLPPHPDTFLARNLKQFAVAAGDEDGYQARQVEVSDFWPGAEQDSIQPLLERADPKILPLVHAALHQVEDQSLTQITSNESKYIDPAQPPHPDTSDLRSRGLDPDEPPPIPQEIEPIIKSLKTAYIQAKQAYRISSSRLNRITKTLNFFVGTHSFHNYTVAKTARDPSASRIIKSIVVDSVPKIINGTEWLSIKLHGQSFMMHQIRKMISMTAMVVRCGADPEKVIPVSFGKDRLSIPKAPGLGLLLERPVFDAFNEKKLVGEFGREPVGFTRYDSEMQAFKQKEIYERIWREEAEGNVYHSYFASVDNLHTTQLLYLSSMGIEAVGRKLGPEAVATSLEKTVAKAVGLEHDSEDETNEAVDG